MRDEKQDTGEMGEAISEAGGDERLLHGDALPAAEPPEGFADRVLAARRAELDVDREDRTPRRRRPGWRPIAASAAAAGAVAAAAAAIVLAARADPVATGALVASERTEVAIGSRAVAVAEPHAALTWRVERGAARVEQTRGDVFYRVERGGRFVVATPAGDVAVLGTCFRVEVTEMTIGSEGKRIGKQAWGGAAVGAVVSAAVLVTVYEGRVLFANERGATEVAAGQSASAASGSAPAQAVAAGAEVRPAATSEELPAPPPSDATREELATREAQQRQEIAGLRAELRSLRAAGGAGAGDKGPGKTKSFLSPTREELLEMARNCAVQFDTPELSPEPMKISPRLANELGLSPEEVTLVERVLQQVSQRVLAQIRAIYVELTGNAAGAEDMTGSAMMREIEDKSGQHDVAEATRQLASERAGLVPPPADPAARSPVERVLRLMQNVGDELERELGKTLGADRAHNLRAARDGWPSRMRMAGCGDEEDQMEAN
jgi:hypothetical protein